VAFININDTEIGRSAAEYLFSLGRFRSYGFVSKNKTDANYTYTFREKGFRAFFRGKADDVRIYRTAAGIERGSLEDIVVLAEWLKSLPKPAAVMAPHDIWATRIVEAAEMADIKIPDSLAVIGVDNDRVYCETSRPMITSITPNHARIGELAARTLKKIMQSPLKAKSPIEIMSPSSHKIIERQSTKPISPIAQIINRAESFIRENATNGISAADVAADLGVSRRLADLRFRQAAGKSILEAILDCRFDEMKRLLRVTDIPVGKVITSCGFKTVSNAKSLFKKRYGMSMSEYRRSCQRLLPSKQI
jgi:LacI family transcriptional regulator